MNTAQSYSAIRLFLPDSCFDVLLVDDEPGLLNLARTYLGMERGLRIITASSAQQAMELITSRHFDAVVSDYQSLGLTVSSFSSW